MDECGITFGTTDACSQSWMLIDLGVAMDQQHSRQQRGAVILAHICHIRTKGTG
jgi:hypothetical protein